MFLHLVPSRDAQIYPPFTNKSRDVSRGQEDERDGVVFDEGDVEARGAAELDIAAGEEVEGGLLEAAFCLLGQRGFKQRNREKMGWEKGVGDDWGDVLLGTAKRSRPSRLCE